MPFSQEYVPVLSLCTCSSQCLKHLPRGYLHGSLPQPLTWLKPHLTRKAYSNHSTSVRNSTALLYPPDRPSHSPYQAWLFCVALTTSVTFITSSTTKNPVKTKHCLFHSQSLEQSLEPRGTLNICWMEKEGMRAGRKKRYKSMHIIYWETKHKNGIVYYMVLVICDECL